MSLRLEQVTCVRAGRALFERLDLMLAPGDAAVVTGPNGAGKSSLIRLAAGLLEPAAGRVVRDGRVALMAEAAALDGERTLAEALGFWATLDALPRAGERVGDALRDVELDALGAVPVRLLSTGQRRRAALARVIASEAPVWLLDEPASGLDAASLQMLEAVIARHRAGGGSVLVATHQPLALADAQTLVLGQ